MLMVPQLNMLHARGGDTTSSFCCVVVAVDRCWCVWYVEEERIVVLAALVVDEDLGIRVPAVRLHSIIVKSLRRK